MLAITTLTASILSILYFSMSAKIIKLRKRYRISIGGAGHKDLEMAIRAHGNFAEYTPIVLLLMLCAEANKANGIMLLILAVLFILGRICHAYAFIFNKYHFKLRTIGMLLTFFILIYLSVLNVILLLSNASF